MKINLNKEMYFILKNIKWRATCYNSEEWDDVYSLCKRAGLNYGNIVEDKNEYPITFYSNGIGVFNNIWKGYGYKDITDLLFPKPLKISDNLKSRLLKKNWLVVCDTEEKFDILMKACETAGITWNDYHPATSWKPELWDFFYCVVYFGKETWYDGITIDYTHTLNGSDEENISNMVFSELLNKDYTCLEDLLNC